MSTENLRLITTAFTLYNKCIFVVNRWIEGFYDIIIITIIIGTADAEMSLYRVVLI